MPDAWPIVKTKHAGTAFSGEGAARTGGRWNSPGARVVYASMSKALAALENLVHLNPPVLFQYAAIPIEFNGVRMEPYPIQDLPEDWREQPPPRSTRQIGDVWVRESRSVILALPSVIIPGETNYLLNPAHPDFKKISIGKPEKFVFDPRLLS